MYKSLVELKTEIVNYVCYNTLKKSHPKHKIKHIQGGSTQFLSVHIMYQADLKAHHIQQYNEFHFVFPSFWHCDLKSNGCNCERNQKANCTPIRAYLCERKKIIDISVDLRCISKRKRVKCSHGCLVTYQRFKDHSCSKQNQKFGFRHLIEQQVTRSKTDKKINNGFNK